ncbi:9 hemes c containing cytochrome [Candidatus Zixiibacteriota bacterium]|nr:9 hemes c containing cytochrome [candidate division Zixibacteria bacterium]
MNTRVRNTSQLWVGVALIAAVLLVPSIGRGDGCYDCHSTWEEGNQAPSKLIHLDVHYKAGLGCSDCHGGDPNADDMDVVRKSKGFKGVPKPAEIPQFCASCHSDPVYMMKHNPSLPTDQLEKYKTSVHGKRLLEKGDTKVANCVSCHSVHNIETPLTPTSTVNIQNVPKTCAKCHADSTYMKGYGIPTNQYNDYVKSVHGVALLVNKDNGAPACNSCHGNHGATPPGVTTLAAVCGTCHALVADNFDKSPHKKAFDEAGFPECETCHSNHYVQKPQLYWVGITDSSLCIRCHAANDGTRGFAVADSVHLALSRLTDAYDRAAKEIDRADQKGMMVTDDRFALNDVKQSIIQGTNEVHLFDASVVEKTSAEAVKAADKVYESGQKKIANYYFRRKGLGIATLLITILVIALFFKMRSLDKN